MSPDSTLTTVDRFAAAFDEKVLNWMQDIKKYHSGTSTWYCWPLVWGYDCYLYLFNIGQSHVCPSYQIVGDNVDLHQKPTHWLIERRARDHRWFHLYAVRDRISGLDQSNDAPIANIATVPVQTLLPSLAECLQLREEFAVLVSRVLVARMAYLEPLKSVVSEHIRHKHYSEVKAKSEIVFT